MAHAVVPAGGSNRWGGGKQAFPFTEAPAQRIAKLRRRFPAGNLPRRYGWVCQMNVFVQLLQLDCMVNIVPVWVTLRAGFAAKHR